MPSENSIEVEVVVPMPVKEKDREKFEALMVEFLFGKDRIRPELEPALRKRGVDINRLASLSEADSLGVCPTPGSLEFIPSAALAKWGSKNGVDFSAGGRVYITFDYDTHAKEKATDRALRVNLGLPKQLAANGKKADRETLGDVTRALFGDCSLADRAQDYLLAHGIDLVDFAAQNASLLDKGRMPPTTRVRPAVADLLNSAGFNTDRIGQIEVDTIRGFGDLVGGLVRDDPWTKTVWSKTTCC